MNNRSLKTLSDVVDWGLCIGCGACAHACKKGGVRMVHVESEGFRPVFDDPHCQECHDCLDICPGARVNGNLTIGGLAKQTEADHELGPTLEIWEGWATDPDIRFRGSSGGLLSALSLYCLEVEGFAGVIHAGMDPATPWMNRNHVSRGRPDILARTGSRYAPSAPCAALSDIGRDAGPHVFIGKPCDTAAVSALRERDPDVQAKVGLVLTFFCAGTPSTSGTLSLMEQLGVNRSDVREVHYRGEGWPGNFRVIGPAESNTKALSYEESWGRLTSHRPLRCNLCADGLGRVADIACGDAWEQYEQNGDPGRSIVLVRTEKGRTILAGAVRAGYVTLERAGAENVLRAQSNLLDRRRGLFGRLLAFRLLGAPIPTYEGFSLFRSWRQIGLRAQLRTVLGTLRRIVQRGWFRRRDSSEAPPQTAEPSRTAAGRIFATEMSSAAQRPLRVCHLAYSFYENDNRVIRYAEALAARGDEVDVIALRRDRQASKGQSKRVHVHRIQRRAVTEKWPGDYLLKILWFFVKSTCLLTVLHVRRRYDIVHVHNVPDFLVFAAIVPKLMGARIILDIHDILPELYAGKFGVREGSALFRALLAVERFSCRFAHHVVVANHLWQDKLVRRTVPAHKCTTIMNYPDLALFRPVAEERKRRDGKFIVLYPGTLNHHQGVDIAVRAFALASDRMPGAEFHIYGEGPARPALKQLAKELGLEERVKLMDRVPLSEVSRVMACADVGVVPKRADGFGNEAFSTKTLEFMACGVPVVVSRTRVDSHYFDDTLVRFFASGQEADLANALLWAYDHREQHGEWIRAARDFVVRYSWQERAIDYHGLVDGLSRTASPRQVIAS
ncbi:MAG: glycosyltransferase [Luteitalea sp.]|nr:glycosyltransferase [Luteitalea sp.]